MEKILKQTLTKLAPMEASEPLPQARKLLPKPVESQAPPFQYNIVQNTPSERHLYIPLPTETQQQRPVVYNNPDPIPVPKSTLYNQRKRAAEAASTSQEKERRTYVRKATFNMCKHCKLPKTVAYGHGRYTGEMGVETFCPSVEGKKYPNKETWLEARKKENPPKKKKERIIHGHE